MNERLIAATDGSALGNPGPAGWAWVLADGRQDWASMRHSTNNRMELCAVKELLLAVPSASILIQCDSQYVINVFTQWLPDWRKRGMRTSSRKPVENQDLIIAIDELLQAHDVTWEWVRGHVGHPLNERADALARFAAERAKRLVDTGSVPPSSASDPPRLQQR